MRRSSGLIEEIQGFLKYRACYVYKKESDLSWFSTSQMNDIYTCIGSFNRCSICATGGQPRPLGVQSVF